MSPKEQKLLAEILTKLGVFLWIKKYNSWDYKELKQMMNDNIWKKNK